MSLSIYKAPASVVFSGNPIIYGITDTNILDNFVETLGVTKLVLTGYSVVNDVNITISYENIFYDIIGVNIPSSVNSTALMADFIAKTLIADERICSRINIVRENSTIYLIEREAKSEIYFLITKVFLLVNPTNPQSSQKFQNENSIHRFGIRSSKLVEMNSSISGSTFSTIPEWYSEAIEVESEDDVTNQPNPTYKISTNSAKKVELSVNELVTEIKEGHFNIIMPEKYFLHDNLDSKFQLYFYRVTGQVDTNGLAIDITRNNGIYSTVIQVIHAKLSTAIQAKVNELGTSLYSYIATKEMFLTWMPDEKVIDIYQPERLYCLLREEYSSDYTVFVKEYYRDITDNSIHTNEYQYLNIDVPGKKIVEISAAFLDIKTDQDDAWVLEKYDIWVEDAVGIVYGKKTYKISYDYQSTARWFYFKNSFGVYECIRTTGIVEKMANIEKEFIDLDLPDNFTRKTKNHRVTNLDKVYKWSIDSGYLSPKFREHFTEFLESEDVYLLQEGQAISVKIEKGNYSIFTDKVYVQGIPFTCELLSVDEDIPPDLSITLPILGDFNKDFNESYFV